MTYKALFESVKAIFRSHNIENPELEARWLISTILNMSEMTLWTSGEHEVEESEVFVVQSAVKERTSGRPLAYILGEKEFWGRSFSVSEGVLIPRPETELVVEIALDHATEGVSPRICDLGTGSGCIGLTLLAELPLAQLTAVDASEKALQIAQENAKALEVEERVTWILGPVNRSQFQPQQFNIVVANPPYIDVADPEVEPNVRKHEPHEALFAEDQGYKLIYDWLTVTQEILEPSGRFVFEIGSKQADSVKKFIDNLNCFKEVEVVKDLAGLDRVVTGIRS